MPNLIPIFDTGAEPEESVRRFGTLTLAASTQGTILSFTNGGTLILLDLLRVQGDADGEFEVHLDAVLIDKLRTTPSKLTDVFSYRSFRLEPGETLDVKVKHYSGAPGLCEFTCALFGRRV